MDSESIKIIETERKFATAVYKNFTSLRYGLEPCCELDMEAAVIKKELCNWDELVALTANVTGTSSLSITEIQTCDITTDTTATTWTSADIQDLLDRLAVIEATEDEKDLHLVYIQSSAATVWTIQHNLGKNPSVRIEDATGADIVGLIDYVDNNNLVITFEIAIEGTAYLN